MNKEDEKLLAEINERCRIEPSLIGQLMSIATNRWYEYLKHLELKRKGEHSFSLQGALHCLVNRGEGLTKHDAVLLTDAIKFSYPKGYESAGCDFDRELLDNFVANAIEQFQPGDSHMELKEMSDLLKTLYEQSPDIEFCEETQRFVAKQTEKTS